MQIYFPSCNFTKASPKTAVAVRNFFKERMPVAGCCLYDKKEYTEDDVALILCQACRQNLESKIKCKTIWEYFLEDETFQFPNYNGMKMNFQDCFRDKDHPEVHEAIREILKKMNIEVIETKQNKENSVYCGTLHYETNNPELLEELKQYPDTKISALPDELQIKLMQDNLNNYDTNYPIIVDCNRCLRGIEIAGGKGIHLLNLVMGKVEF